MVFVLKVMWRGGKNSNSYLGSQSYILFGKVDIIIFSLHMVYVRPVFLNKLVMCVGEQKDCSNLDWT